MMTTNTNLNDKQIATLKTFRKDNGKIITRSRCIVDGRTGNALVARGLLTIEGGIEMETARWGGYTNPVSTRGVYRSEFLLTDAGREVLKSL